MLRKNGPVTISVESVPGRIHDFGRGEYGNEGPHWGSGTKPQEDVCWINPPETGDVSIITANYTYTVV